MRCKSPKSLLRNISKAFLLFFCLFAAQLWAYPDQERLPVDPSSLIEPPLDLLSALPDARVPHEDGRTLFFAIDNAIRRVDIASWALAADQVPSLTEENTDESIADLAGNIGGLAVKNGKLYATQDDGDLLIIDLNDITAVPTALKIGGTLGSMVADTDTGTADDKLYFTDTVTNQINVFDISDSKLLASIDLFSNGVAVVPQALLYVPLSSQADKLFVASLVGVVFVIVEGATTATVIDLDSAGGNDLVALAASPQNDFVFVLDSTDRVIHIIRSSDNAIVIDTDIPIDLSDANGTLRDITITDVKNPDDIYAFVAGSAGISIIDLNIGSGFDGFTILDFGSDEDDDEEPLDLGGSLTPQQIFAFSEEYVLSINGDISLSVLSDNPFVSITGDSLDGGDLSTTGDFTLSFEADEAGTYSVRLGGGIDASGSELTSGTLDEANTTITTASISYSDSFSEGNNEVFVFVTNSAGRRGHDMRLITADTPPPAVTIESTGFGNQSVYLNFARVAVSDISSYRLYADTDAALVLTKTDVGATVTQPSSGSTLQGVITGLVNGISYFLAIEAVDEAGNVGTRSGGESVSTIPQATLGIVGLSGEAGCALIRREGTL